MVKKIRINEAYTDDRVRRSVENFITKVQPEYETEQRQIHTRIFDFYRLCKAIDDIIKMGKLDELYEYVDISYVADGVNELADIIADTTKNIKYINDKADDLYYYYYKILKGIGKVNSK